jgi:haloalkane dehalogenase
MSTAAPLSKRYQLVDGKRMAFHERGDGDAIIFLHGNPTSSYIWRNVVPHVADQGRCIVPDLIGMGDSDKLEDSGPDSYSFEEHRRYLDGFLERMELGDGVTLVLHDWGAALGIEWARGHPDRVAGIAYMEGIVGPISLDDWGEAFASFFRSMRSDAGEEMVLEKNLFVEGIPLGVMREFSDEEMAEYRRPFAAAGEDRRPTLSWPRQLPIAGEPAEVVGGEPAAVVEIVERNAEWMSQIDIPKLFINSEPGYNITGRTRDRCRTWPAQTEVTVPGIHYLQEDSPDLIGAALSQWLTSIRGGDSSSVIRGEGASS